MDYTMILWIVFAVVACIVLYHVVKTHIEHAKEMKALGEQDNLFPDVDIPNYVPPPAANENKPRARKTPAKKPAKKAAKKTAR